MSETTQFYLWRKRVGLSQDGAARVLAVATRTVQYWDKGVGPRHERMVPPLGTRVLMAVVASKNSIEPWRE